MEIIGKLIIVLPEVSGEGARGKWVRGGFVIQTEEQFTRKVAFSLWGEDRLKMLATIPMGQTIKVAFNAESREYNSRWYTDLRCNQIEVFTPQMYPGSYPSAPQYNQGNQGYIPNQPNNYGAPMPQNNNMQNIPPTPPPTNQMQGGSIEQDNLAEDGGGDDLPF